MICARRDTCLKQLHKARENNSNLSAERLTSRCYTVLKMALIITHFIGRNDRYRAQAVI